VRPRRWEPWLVLLLCVLVLLQRFAAQGASPVRALLVVAFFAVAPGLAVVGLLRLADPWLRAALVFGLSLSIDAVVGGILSYAGLWSPVAGLLILVAISVVGAAGQELSLRWRAAR
jgi:hypothetical protein